MKIDFIGDLHGYADQLRKLLERMGYTQQGEVYRHPERKVLFLGDYIDRGPQIRETLQLVRKMVEAGEAIALMGNHEYNALCFFFEQRNGGHLRKHSIKNILQHYHTLSQFKDRQDEYEDYIYWMMGLPLWYETTTFRAVHACWDAAHISVLREWLNDSRLNEQLLHQAVDRECPLFQAMEETLKGKEIRLPEGYSFHDKDATERNEIRIKWWENPSQTTYRQISVIPLDHLPDRPIDHGAVLPSGFYGPEERAVFFGHYWLTGLPALFRENVCCLDYCVARKGFLAAYRFDGERQLSQDKLVYV